MTNRQIRRMTEKEERRNKGKRQERRASGERTSIRQFLGEVRQELSRVSWPTRQEVITFTTVTVITSTAVTLFVFVLDLAFKATILELIRNL